MWQFIVSGYIPGTEYQLTFDSWVNIALISTVVVLLLQLARSSDADTKALMATLRQLDGRYLLPQKKD